jgi:hypothetical protein
MSKKDVVVMPLEDYIGEERLDELASKEHKAKELPERIRSKRKMSPNSLKNLVQYNPDIKKETKKKILQGLRTKVDESKLKKEDKLEEEEATLVEDEKNDKILSLFKKLEVKVGGESIFLSELIDKVFPTYQTLDKKECIIFNNISATYLKDFENEELSYSDMDDVFSLALNKILELRLLKKAKKKPNILSDTFVSLEKLKKQNDKLKESLASTRKERKKHTLKTGVSIIDLAANFDEERKERLDIKEKELLKKEEEFMENRASHGNRDDMDAK